MEIMDLQVSNCTKKQRTMANAAGASLAAAGEKRRTVIRSRYSTLMLEELSQSWNESRR
jgi:hypothetical protein